MSNPVSTEASQQPPTPPLRPATSTRWKIVVPVIIVILVATAGAAYAYHRHHGKSTAKRTATTTHKPVAKPATFALPTTLDGLAESSNEQVTSLSGAAVTDLTASLTDIKGQPVVGVYGPNPPNAAILVGLPATPADLDGEIANVFDALRSTQFFSIPDPTPAATGLAGVEMQCSNASLIGGVPITTGICVATGSGGSVLLIRLTKTGAQAADILKATLPTFEKS